MLEYRVLPALAAVASAPSFGAGDASLAQETQLVVSAAIGRLVAVQSALPKGDLEVVVKYMVAVAMVPGCALHLSSALWCLCRHEDNRYREGAKRGTVGFLARLWC